MNISDFKVGESFAYIVHTGDKKIDHIMIGRLDAIIGKSTFNFSGAGLYYFKDSHTTLEMGQLGDPRGWTNNFTKDVKSAKHEAIKLLFKPTKKFMYKEY